MNSTRIVSWNVNGARAVHKKGFLEWLDDAQPDLLCLQETRAHPDQLEPALAAPLGYHTIWNPSRAKKGYSGTAIFSRRPPISVEMGLGHEEFDVEGRTIVADFDEFVLINAYFPNGRRDHSRVDFKMEFCDLFLQTCEDWRAKGRSVIFCGDLNTSHREIDLARPAANQNTTGFLPREREWIDRVVEGGWVDSFRQLYPDTEGAYTWWSMPMRARERNVGWRLDYIFLSPDLVDRLVDARILADVMGSDHCPAEVELKSHGS